MKTHLEDHEFTTVVEGLELAPEAAEHLAACISCRQQVTALQRGIVSRRDAMRDQAPDWDRQREEIMAQLPAAPSNSPRVSRRWLRPLLAAAAVLLVAFGLNFLWHPSTAVEPAAASELQIEQILAEVDAVLADDGLPGFESIDPGIDDLESIFENGES